MARCRSSLLGSFLIPVLVFVVALGLAGCGTSGDETSYSAEDPAAEQEPFDSDPAEPAADAPDDEPTVVDVPDLTGEDGADAVSELEDLGLTVAFVEEDGREASGCEVETQDVVGDADPGSEVILDLDCRQVDWENQEGEDWDAFNTSYSSGWDSGCDEAFSQSPDGSLYFEDQEFTSLDCQSNNPGNASSADIPSDVPDDPAYDGEQLGTTDGCESAFSDLSPDGTYLYYGEDSYDSSYCP